MGVFLHAVAGKQKFKGDQNVLKKVYAVEVWKIWGHREEGLSLFGVGNGNCP